MISAKLRAIPRRTWLYFFAFAVFTALVFVWYSGGHLLLIYIPLIFLNAIFLVKVNRRLNGLFARLPKPPKL